MKHIKKVVSIIFIIALLTAGFFILRWYTTKYDEEKTVDSIIKNMEIKEMPKEQEEIIEINANLANVNQTLIEVDLSKLKEKNEEVKGWIQIPGTNLSYPFVQSTDNHYYLTHSLDKKVTTSGCLFADYNNKFELTDKNFILYDHDKETTKTTELLGDILNNEWLNNSKNHIIKTSTDGINGLWQVFSIYKIKDTRDYLKTDFFSRDEHQEYINLITNRSLYNFNSKPTTNDKLITISTNNNEDERLVIHGKLIKKTK